MSRRDQTKRKRFLKDVFCIAEAFFFFFSYFQRCFVVGPTSERALARFLVRLTSRYRFSQWMGRGRFFPCRDGTKETKRTRPLFAQRRKASGPSRALRGSRRRSLLRATIFFSSPLAGGDSSRPPSSHKKRSVLPNASPFFRLVLRRGDSASRPLECVFGKHHPNFVVVRAVFRLAASSKTIDDAALRSSGVRVSNPVRPAANTSGDTKKCLLFFYKRSSSPRPAAQPGSDRK